jgi:enamine deaminase RidA (YjgF/YER057c/UK114 family)
MTSAGGRQAEPPSVRNFSWSRRSPDGHVVASAAPINSDGSWELGDIETQAALTYRNLEASLEAVGSSLSAVLHVTVYLTDLRDGPTTKQVWERVFHPPYPGRATIGISELGVAGMRIEVVAQAFAHRESRG